jgi:ABC-2 type transport system ATP-binding protein
MPRAEAEKRAVAMLEEFGLTDVVDEFAVNYSMGMKKKLGLACALIHDPQVLILDEPINGLDPRAAREVQERLKQAAASGKTIFMSTHLLDMAEKVCTRVGIVHKGNLVATGTMAELRERVRRDAATSDSQDASLEEVFLKVTDEGAGEVAPAATP